MGFFIQNKQPDEAGAQIERAVASRDRLQRDVDQIQRQYDESSKRGDPDRPGTSAYVWGLELDEAKAKLVEGERTLSQVVEQTAVVAPAPTERVEEAAPADDVEAKRGPERDTAMEILEGIQHIGTTPVHCKLTRHEGSYRFYTELALPFLVGPKGGSYAMYGGYGVPCGLGGSSYTAADPVSVGSPGGEPADIGAGTADYYLELHFTITAGVVSYVDATWVASPTANTEADLYMIIGGRVGAGGEWVQFHVGNITIPMR